MRSRTFPFPLLFFFSDYSFILRSLRKIVEEGKGGRKKKSAYSQVHDDYITYELRNLKSIFFPLKKKKVEQTSSSKLVHPYECFGKTSFFIPIQNNR